jgi:hypothetical protein
VVLRLDKMTETQVDDTDPGQFPPLDLRDTVVARHLQRQLVQRHRVVVVRAGVEVAK